MSKLAWAQVGERRYETGVDRGVLYIPNEQGAYEEGHAWSGLTTVTQSPSGAESNKQYADNQVYLNLISAEEFGATIEAFAYPDAFGQCDGTYEASPGVYVGQQSRKSFGFSYRSRVGNDLKGTDFGYKLHLVYNAMASVSEKAHATINDSPEAAPFSWELTTTPVEVGEVNGVELKPTAILTIDSTKVDSDALATLEEFLWGTEGNDPMLPSPADVLAMFSSTVNQVDPSVPAYDSATKTITVPNVTGVIYTVGNQTVEPGPLVITKDTVVKAKPATGYKFPAVVDTDWLYKF